MAAINALVKVVTRIQQEVDIPEDWENSTIVLIFKRKEDEQVYNNYRCISLQSVPRKVFTKWIQNRIKQ